jgi:hypothetical protein
MEVISFIMSERERVSVVSVVFPGDEDETDRFSYGVGQLDLVSGVMPVKA